ncbi:MAG: phosphatase PAP2 family protein [Actinomycetes bacterium]
MRETLRPYAFAVCLAVITAAVALLVATAYGLPLRDPDGIAGPAVVRLPAIVLAFLLADVVPRAVRARALRSVVRERLSPQRLGVIAVGLGSFYVTYVAYRNLKGALPFARPEILDSELLRLDRAMALGHEPADVLHALLGTELAAHVLSVVYLLFLLFVPLSLAAALVWGRGVRAGAYYVTALCLNWVLGTVSYYLVPSLGPVFVRPGLYADLPDTGVSALQESLASTRAEVLADPVGADAIAGIAGFASLHCSIVLTAALVAGRLGLPLAARVSAWAFFALTVVATTYFGWHYVVDDVAGVAIGVAAVVLAERATGWRQDEPTSPGRERLPEVAAT